MRRAVLVISLATQAACSGTQTPEAESPAADPSGSSEPSVVAEAAESAVAGAEDMSPAALSAYEAGVRAFQAGDLPTALAQLDKALSVDPRSAQALVARGMVKERTGDKSAALADYAAALSARPNHGSAIAARVALLIRMARLSEAEDFARDVVGRHPDSAAALCGLAEVRSARGDSTSAQELAQKALKKDPDYRPAMVTLARDHYRARRLDLALYTLQAILDGYGQENPPRDKNNPEARFLRALIFKEQGRRKAAIDEFKSVLQTRPDLVDARLHLAAYMLEAGNADEARPLLEDALKYDPSNVLVHLNLGDAYRLMGKPKDALDHLAWVSRKDATLAQVHYNLGLVYLFSAQVPGLSEEQAIDQAIESFERFKKLEPRAARGQGDDVDELIARARNKKSIIEAMKQVPAETETGPQGEDEEWDDEG